MLNENEIQNDTDESLLAELDSIDSERSVRSAPKSTPAQKKARNNYMRLYRARLNDPQKKIESQWSENLATLPESDRKRLLDAQDEASFLNWLMAKVDRGVSFCGQGIGVVDVDYPNPICVYEEVKAWIESGNTFVHCSFPRSLAGLLESDLQQLDDKEFILYGIKTHISFSIWHHFLENLFVWLMRNQETSNAELLAEVADLIEMREFAEDIELDLEDLDYSLAGRALLEYRGKQSEPVSGIQRTGLTMTEREETELAQREIRKSVLGR
jgi:hypothetical protein